MNKEGLQSMLNLSNVENPTLLLRKILSDKKVVSSSMPYIIEHTFPHLSVLHLDRGITIVVDDVLGHRYKVMTSSCGRFDVSQSCTKGMGRDKSFGNWRVFLRDRNITHLLFVSVCGDEFGVFPVKVGDIEDGSYTIDEIRRL